MLLIKTRFHDLAWTPATDSHKRGIIAGAHDNGSLGLWDADQLLADATNASLSSEKIHSGAIKALQFNPKIPNFLATGGARGELFISDLNNLDSPIRLGSTAARADDIDCLDWNKKVANILVTGSSGGFVTVWDMKTKKESLTMNNYGRKPASAIAWDPEKPTRLITAVSLEQEPVILVWDLRNSNAPEKIMKGHDSGVLSLSWCQQDSDLLLSCGKDNRTMLWNPQTGEALGEYPVVTNWTFQTRWNPTNPSMFATASFDGKLQIQTLQNTNPGAAPSPEQNQAADGEDFFSKAQTQPQTSSFSLNKAPKWLERPVSVSFGFGGRLITVRPDAAKPRASKVEISKFEVDEDVGSATETFEKALQSGNLADLCQQRVSEAKSDEDKADWQVIKTLVSTNPRQEIVKYLGYDDTDEATNGIANLDVTDSSSEFNVTSPQATRKQSAMRGHQRFQSIFESTPDGDFLSELAATKGTKTNQPFQIFTGNESEADRKITRALLLGHFEKALDVCLAEDRMSDAFMIAICGGDECTKKAQEAYFAKQSGGPNYLRLLASVVGKNLWDTVHNADLANWREVMATLCTFADETEFPDLCEALGDRLEEQSSEDAAARKDASFCFMAGSKLEKVVAIWIKELREHEDAGASQEDASSAFSLHARGLQDLIEKVTIFRKVVNFKDTELNESNNWRLNTLYSKYLEYADIVASHGQLAVAQRYLDLLPAKYPEADVARSRIQQATKKPGVPAVATQQPKAAATTRQKALPTPVGYQAPQSMFTPAAPPAPTPFAAPTNTYAPPNQATTQPQNPYAPPQTQAPAQSNNPYAPAGGYQPPQPLRQGFPQSGYGMPQPGGIAPPPRGYNQSPAVAPPSQAKDMKAWNDIPEGFARIPTPRRGTPGAPAQAAPFPGQQAPGPQTIPPPVAPPYGTRQRATPPVPPPPKGSAPPPRVASPLAGSAAPERPMSATNNPYAPSITSPPMGQSMIPPPIPRGPSPYNAPPSSAPPPNRYAPAPGSQPTAPQGRPQVAPPPQGGFQPGPPPANPYAPRGPPQAPTPNQYAPSQLPPSQGPPMSIPQPQPNQQFSAGPTPMNGPSQQQAGPGPVPDIAGPQSPAAAPPVRKHRKLPLFIPWSQR